MEQINMFQEMYPTYKIRNHIRLIEMFGGIGFQSKALDNLHADFERWKYIEWDKYAVDSYNAIHGTNFTTTDVNDVHAEDLEIVDTDKNTYVLVYSFPCTDLSNAGEKKGMAKGSGTRSGLLWEVERILNECKKLGNLPQVLILENVTMIHSKKIKADFEKWILALEKLGYSNYWKDLNAKDFGIPQNRDRTFMVSILGEYNYTFPKKQKLKTRLRDMLLPENEVPEKFYLRPDQIEYLKTTEFECSKYEHIVTPIERERENAITQTLTARDHFFPKCVEYPQTIGTLCARDWKYPKCIEVGKANINDGMHDSAKRIYDEDGLCPTLNTCGGGNLQAKVMIHNDRED